MSKLEIINSHIPICPYCNSKMDIDLVRNTIKCQRCKSVLKIIELGRNDRDFICDKVEKEARK